MAFFICAAERKKQEKVEVFLNRMYSLKKEVEDELNLKLKLICHFENGKMVWIEMRPNKQRHPLFNRENGC